MVIVRARVCVDLVDVHNPYIVRARVVHSLRYMSLNDLAHLPTKFNVRIRLGE